MTEPRLISQDHVSDIGFDRAFAQELSAAEQQHLRAHLADCARCRERQSLLAEERATFLREAPSWREYHAQHGKRKPPKPGASVKLLVTLSAATALAASVLLMYRASVPAPIRTKGSAQLGFYVKRGAQVTRGRPDQAVSPNDVLRFTYSSTEPVYFALLGRDEHSAILFYPVAKETAALPKGNDVPLGFGVEIDSQPGQERFYALFCSKPVQLSPIVAALDRTDALIAPEHCVTRELRLNKVVP